MKIEKKSFGKAQSGTEVFLYTLSNKNGMKANVTNFGAILVSLLVPDKAGNIADVVLGFDNLKDYFQNGSFFGATVGRNANRIANAKFEIDGTEYRLDANENGNNLHSHFENGYHMQVWNVKADEENNALILSYMEPDGSMGFPGNLHISVTYKLTDDNALELHYNGVSDKKTIINVTNHSYFNLSGHASGSIQNEKLWLKASRYTEIVPGAIPTGKLLPVAGTPMDFTSAKRIGDEIDSGFEQLKMVQGYDHNWVLDKEDGRLEKIAEITDEEAGRTMELYTDLPGVQFYAGNCINPTVGKDGITYAPRMGLCLETQYFPNSINEPEFKSPVFDAGEEYQTTTIYKFI